MSPHAATVTRSLARCLLAAAVAACGTPSPLPSTTASEPAAATSPGGLPGDPTAVPGSQPPEAVLTGFAEGPVTGDLGTSTWDGAASDSPWILGSAAGSARAGAPLLVTFRPKTDASEWQASWAHVAGGQLGEIADVLPMTDGPVVLPAPATGGTWSLQVFARFGAGRDAAWYWQVEVVP